MAFEENDVHDFAQMVLRLYDAVSKGTARRNLRLMSQVIVGLKRHRLFEFNNFQRWATRAETLTRDEILLLGTAYRLKKKGVQEEVWAALKEALVPEPFKTNADLEAVCAALARTGLVLPASAWGGMVYLFGDGVVQLGRRSLRMTDLSSAPTVARWFSFTEKTAPRPPPLAGKNSRRFGSHFEAARPGGGGVP